MVETDLLDKNGNIASNLINQLKTWNVVLIVYMLIGWLIVAHLSHVSYLICYCLVLGQPNVMQFDCPINNRIT